MAENKTPDSFEQQPNLPEPQEAERVSFTAENSTKKPMSKKTKTIILFSTAGVSLVVLIISLVFLFSGPKMPDLVGEKPYDAWVELAEVIPEEQIVFQTQDEFPALPEQESDYTEWTVIKQSISPGMTIGSNEAVTVTITPDDNLASQRKKIIDTFIADNADDETAFTYEDLGDILVVKLQVSSDLQPYFPIGMGELLVQSYVDSLSKDLAGDVIFITYLGDWICQINYAQSSQSPNSTKITCGALVKSINDEAINIAKENSIRALENFMLLMNNDGGNASYKVVDQNNIYISGAPKRGSSYNMIGDDIKDGQRSTSSAALFTRANVTYTFLDGDGYTVKTYYASPTSFIVDPKTGKFIP